MTVRQRVTSAIGVAVAGTALACGAAALAGPAAAQPLPPPPPPGPVAPPPPGGPPPVPEIPAVYGQGQSPGPFGFIADAWSTFNGSNPLNTLTLPQDIPIGPPPGAGTGPPLPPGTISLTSPETSTATLGPVPVPGAPPPPPGAPQPPPGPLPPAP